MTHAAPPWKDLVMPLDLGNPIWLQLVANAETPAALAGYAGRLLAIPAGTPIPTGIDTLIVSGVTVPGYHALAGAQHTWVMTPTPDPNVAALNTIPGSGGWVRAASRTTYADIGMALLSLGVPSADVRTGLAELYWAAVTNYQATPP